MMKLSDSYISDGRCLECDYFLPFDGHGDDCLVPVIAQLEVLNTQLEGENEALKGAVQQVVEKIYDEDDPDVAKPWLVENVLGLLVESLVAFAPLTEKEQEDGNRI